MDWWEKEELSHNLPFFPLAHRPTSVGYQEQTCYLRLWNFLLPYLLLSHQPFQGSARPLQIQSVWTILPSVMSVICFKHRTCSSLLQDCAQESHSFPPEATASSIWASMQTILAGAAMAVHPLVMDTSGTTCRTEAKVHKDILRDSPARVQQKMMMALILFPVPMESSHEKEALKLAAPLPESQQPEQISYSKPVPCTASTYSEQPRHNQRTVFWYLFPRMSPLLHSYPNNVMDCFGRIKPPHGGFTSGFPPQKDLVANKCPKLGHLFI